MFDESIPPYLQYYLGKPETLVSQWLFLDSPLAIISTLGTYFSALAITHRLMRNRKPLKLRKVLVIYNAFQVLYSAYICKEVLLSAIQAGYKLSCSPVNLKTISGVRMARAFWLFCVSKAIDLADTIFFVLRKKYNQITFLHMYHHSTMILNWYLGTLYSPGGQAFISVFLNAFVHVIMYMYYMLAAMGPIVQKYLWWKRYLTQIQLVQFLLVMLHLSVGLYNKCKSPFWLNWFTITYLTTMIMLFSNFYYKSYKNKRNIVSKHENRATIDYKAAGDSKHE